MTLTEFTELNRAQTTIVSFRQFSQYDGLVTATKDYNKDAKSAVIFLNGGSVQFIEASTSDAYYIIEGDAQTIYMEQAKAATVFALSSRYNPTTFSVEIDGLDLICTFNDLQYNETKTLTTVISCDPDDPDKASLRDGYYSKKHIGYFIALQLNASFSYQKYNKINRLKLNSATSVTLGYTKLVRKPSPTVSSRDFSEYDGLYTTKENISQDAKSAIILNGLSVQFIEASASDAYYIIEGDAQTVYMEQAKAATIFTLSAKYHPTMFSVEIDGLDLICTFKGVTPESINYFGSDPYTTIVDCDPTNPDKKYIKDSYYANKHMGHFIALQLNASLKYSNGEKFYSLRLNLPKYTEPKSNVKEREEYAEAKAKYLESKASSKANAEKGVSSRVEPSAETKVKVGILPAVITVVTTLAQYIGIAIAKAWRYKR